MKTLAIVPAAACTMIAGGATAAPFAMTEPANQALVQQTHWRGHGWGWVRASASSLAFRWWALDMATAAVAASAMCALIAGAGAVLVSAGACGVTAANATLGLIGRN